MRVCVWVCVCVRVYVCVCVCVYVCVLCVYTHGRRQLLHIQCKGFTKNSIGNEIIPEDGRPTVIIESLEALGT